MIDSICIFEDQHFRRLLPLAYTRPVYDLRCGILTLRQKIQRRYAGVTVSLHAREILAGLVRQQNPGVRVNSLEGEGCLFLNGRILAGPDLAEKIPLEGPDQVYMADDVLVAARVSGRAFEAGREMGEGTFSPLAFAGIPRVKIALKLIGYAWDLVNANGRELEADFAALAPEPAARIQGKVYEGAHLVNPGNIVIGEGSRVKPGVVLDAENGPIYIGKNVTIFPNAVIEGPAFIGDGTLIKIGAKIYEDTSIGEVCKVGGEVEASIIHAYSNKQHDGFLGHAYLGEWVNLGADTNNSDLKNNYGNVKMCVDGESVDTGSMFVGLIMADHSKSSINSMFNTGTVVGVSSNIFGHGFPPKCIPSFAWGGSAGLETYDLDKALDVARRVLGRRKIDLSSAEECILRDVFEQTRKERKVML